MAEQNRPASKELAPDPSNNYERSHPEREAGAGRMDNNTNATPTPAGDSMADAVGHAQDGSRQLNAIDEKSEKLPPQPDHSMLEEEPLGWDQTPQDLTDPKTKRHPRTGGKGGTPDAGDSEKNS